MHSPTRQCGRRCRLVLGIKMDEGTKVGLDVAAGTGTVAAWLGHAPDVVAVFTGVYILVRLWETETVKKLTRRG